MRPSSRWSPPARPLALAHHVVLPCREPVTDHDFARLAMRLRSAAPSASDDQRDAAAKQQRSETSSPPPPSSPRSPATPRETRERREVVPRPLLRGCHVAGVPGLRLVYDAVSPESEAEMLAALELDRGTPASNIHQATQWGWRFSTWNRAPPLHAEDRLAPLPAWQRAFVAAMLRADAGREYLPSRSEWGHGVEHALVNTYQPGDGVSPHTDDLTFWTGWVIGLSLGSDVTMLFHPPASGADAAAPVAVRLPARSLYVLTGDARWTHRHEITRALADWVDGAAVPRRFRASVTWRGISEAWLPRALADAH